MTPDQKISFLLTGGIDERTQEEMFAPVLQQGGAPLMAISDNTRLSIRPGACTRSAKFTEVGAYAADVYGVVPSVCGNSAVIFCRQQNGGNQTVSNAGRNPYGNGTLLSSLAPGFRQNAFLPLEMTGGGTVPTAQAKEPPAVVYDTQTGLLWFAYLSPTDVADEFSLMVVAQTEEQAAAGPPVKVMTVTVSSPSRRWVGLTSHGLNGIRLWYIHSTQLYVRTLSISGNVVTSGSAVSVYTPAGPDDLVPAVCSSPTSAQSQYAFIASVSSSNPDDGIVIRYNVANNTQISQNYPGAFGSGVGTARWCSVRSGSLNGTFRVIFSFLNFNSTSTLLGMCDVNLTTTWTQNTSQAGFASCAFLEVPSLSAAHAAFAVTSEGSTKIWFVNIAGSLQSGPVISWGNATMAMGEWRPSSSESYPLVFTVPSDQTDASVEMHLVGSLYTATPVGRWGVVRGGQSPVNVFHEAAYSNCNTMTIDGTLVVTYAQKTYTNECGDARYVMLRMGTGQPTVVHDKDGCALFSGALAAQWDGVEVVELGGPLHAPNITVENTAGSGTVLPAGAYEFCCLFRWTDASGLTHRSRPSNFVQLTSDGATTKPLVHCTTPMSMRNAALQERIEIVLYARAVNGLTLHEVDALPDYRDFYEARWENLPASKLDGSGALLFSTGAAQTELTPQPPPPLWDIAIVGSRAWGIDAESRSRLVFSKLRVAGVGFEFHPALEVIFPGGAGKLMAVREWQGAVLVLTERGVYQLSGLGPNNAGLDGSFTPPVKIADIGCTNRSSVAVTPGGLLWQSDDDLVTLTPAGGVQIVSTIDATDTVRGVAVLKNQDEALVFNSEPGCKVWNYKLDRWTTWDNYTHGVSTHAVNHPSDQDVVLVLGPSGGSSALYRIDGDETGAALSMRWETDWLLLGGDFQDRVLLRAVIFNGRSLGTHSLTLEVFTDYKYDIPTTTRTWDFSELSAISVGGRWTVRVEPDSQAVRALKIRVSDQLTGETSEGLDPRSVTLVYAVDGLVNEDAFLQGSYR